MEERILRWQRKLLKFSFCTYLNLIRPIKTNNKSNNPYCTLKYLLLIKKRLAVKSFDAN